MYWHRLVLVSNCLFCHVRQLDKQYTQAGFTDCISTITQMSSYRKLAAQAYTVVAGRRHMPQVPAVIFLQHEIYKNSVSSAEAGIGMEGQIMCIVQCTFYVISSICGS